MHYKLTLNSMLQQVLYHQRGQSWRRLIVTMCRMMVIYFQQCISVLMQFYHPTHTYGCLKHYLIFLITAMSKSQEKKKKRDSERERDVCLFYIMLSFKCIGGGENFYSLQGFTGSGFPLHLSVLFQDLFQKNNRQSIPLCLNTPETDSLQ